MCYDTLELYKKGSFLFNSQNSVDWIKSMVHEIESAFRITL